MGNIIGNGSREIRFLFRFTGCGRSYFKENVVYYSNYSWFKIFVQPKFSITDPKKKRDLRNFQYVIYAYKKAAFAGFNPEAAFLSCNSVDYFKFACAAATRAIGTR